MQFVYIGEATKGNFDFLPSQFIPGECQKNNIQPSEPEQQNSQIKPQIQASVLPNTKISGFIQVNIICGQDIPIPDINLAFCVVHVQLPNDERFSSVVVKNTTNPVWNLLIPPKPINLLADVIYFYYLELILI